MTLNKSQSSFREYLRKPEFRDNYASQSGVHRELGVRICDVMDDGVSMAFTPTADLYSSDKSMSCDMGPVATVMDSAMGLSVMLSLEEFSSIATLELRIDWIEDPSPDAEILIETKVDAVKEDLVFVSAQAKHEDCALPFCRGTARFMLTSGKGSLSNIVIAAAKAQEFPDERGE